MPDSVPDTTATSITHLPVVVLQNVLSRTCSRRIAGTHRHAAVSKLWRQLAANSPELLHLLVQQDTHNSQEADANEVVAYLQHHGQHVLSLHLLGGVPGKSSVVQQALRANTGCLANLRSLVLDSHPSYLDIAPRLPSLSRLEHLTAAVGARDAEHREQALLVGPDSIQGGGTWCGVTPNVTSLVPPSLSSLTLNINSSGHKCILDARLQQLLPSGLHQLRLQGVGAPYTRLAPDTLRHLSHLRHLSLEYLVLGDIAELHQLGSLQGLEVSCPTITPGDLVSLSDKVIAYDCMCSLQQHSSLVHLSAVTALTFRPSRHDVAPDLAPCTRLCCLHLLGVPRDIGPWLACVTSVTSLRRLGLSGGPVPAEQLAVVSQLTWLTCLLMGDLSLEAPPAHEQQQQQQQQPPLPPPPQQHQQQLGVGSAGQAPEQQPQRPDPRLALVQALHGLQHLEVPEQLLLAPGGHQMLDALTALTRLDICAMDLPSPWPWKLWGTINQWLGAGPVQPALQQRQQQQQQQEEDEEDQQQQQRRRRQHCKLQQVVYYGGGYYPDVRMQVKPPGAVHPSPLPGVRVTVVHDLPFFVDEPVLPRCTFPALRGVWELDG